MTIHSPACIGGGGHHHLSTALHAYGHGLASAVMLKESHCHVLPCYTVQVITNALNVEEGMKVVFAVGGQGVWGGGGMLGPRVWGL